MTKSPVNPLPALVQNFFARHWVAERQLSPCTVASYRDTAIALWLGHESPLTTRQYIEADFK